ncbi:MAG: energy transducer TonB [Planctomycetota bacterium]
MRRRGEGLWFWAALLLSAGAHAAAPLLGSDDARSEEPDFALEEREVRPPMTLRILAEPRTAAPVEAPVLPDPILTSDAGARSVLALEPDATPIERVRPEEAPPPPPVAEPPPPEPEPEPLDVPLETRRPEPEPVPEAPEPELTKAPTTDDVELVSPVQQEASSSVRTRASSEGFVNTDPPYPIRAMQRRMEGTVLLDVTIGTDGRVVRVELSESSGHRILDDQALKYVKRWRFTPARDGSGAAVEDTLQLPIRFFLRD